MEELLGQLAGCQAPTVSHMTSGVVGSPLFVVCGACPSAWAGMQTVMFSAMEVRGENESPEVDFWWIKPIDKYGYSASKPKEKSATLQQETLHCHEKGKHKNSPGRSKQVYAPIAALFKANSGDGSDQSPEADDGAAAGDITWRLELVTSPSRQWRATMRAPRDPAVVRYLLLVWQESWSSPLARNKWIVGKLLYQRSVSGGQLYAAPYRIDGSKVSVFLEHEEAVPSLIPPDRFKLGCVVREGAATPTDTVIV